MPRGATAPATHGGAGIAHPSPRRPVCADRESLQEGRARLHAIAPHPPRRSRPTANAARVALRRTPAAVKRGDGFLCRLAERLGQRPSLLCRELAKSQPGSREQVPLTQGRPFGADHGGPHHFGCKDEVTEGAWKFQAARGPRRKKSAMLVTESFCIPPAASGAM